MSKDVQKKYIQINHALSGYHGEDLRNSAFQIYEMRKQTLKKLQRRKRLAAVISDELYGYLEKYPEEKMGLHQETYKKKKAKFSQGDEKYMYNTPSLEGKYKTYFGEEKGDEMGKMKKFFKHQITQESNSQQN